MCTSPEANSYIQCNHRGKTINVFISHPNVGKWKINHSTYLSIACNNKVILIMIVALKDKYCTFYDKKYMQHVMKQFPQTYSNKCVI